MNPTGQKEGIAFRFYAIVRDATVKSDWEIALAKWGGVLDLTGQKEDLEVGRPR